jgi:hypothetical protein
MTQPALFQVLRSWALILLLPLLAAAPASANRTAAVPPTIPSLQLPQLQPNLRVESEGSARWDPERALPLVLWSRIPLPRIHFVAGPFTETTRFQSLQLKWCLAASPEGPCIRSLSLPANQPREAWLIAEGAGEAGSYLGQFHFVAETGDSVSRQMTINISSRWWRRAGIAALLLGIALSFGISIWIPHSRDRDLALRPFVLMRARVDEAALDLPAGSFPGIHQRIEEVRRDTEARRLKERGMVPGRIPGPPLSAASLEERNKEAARLEELVAGIESLAAAARRTSDPDKRAKLDELGADPTFPRNLESQMPRALGRNAAAGFARSATLTPSRLVSREEARNGVAWAVWAAISALVGYFLMIDADQAFGGWLDVAAVLLWALGVTTTGARLTDLTAGNLRTALRV